ncbi:hypothetical protein [Ureibacillus sinduriensis]|uniref:Uncharacterized protein n=1 Tax=Ureibacillus sinduriensis BLB-1 = JCM 15800 TaxID=1384057 RepID=A0A0A3IMK1_9BACL|nr:hypothetical protein [Ureibacillus sinduriensis]KGR76067.1 hypothetical protein CD33_07760 [Ureibacillus sinduriensis BLB-1 = JCM 15800]
MTTKNGMQKFLIVFIPFGILLWLLLTQNSDILDKIVAFIPIIAVTTFWFWVNHDRKREVER